MPINCPQNLNVIGPIFFQYCSELPIWATKENTYANKYARIKNPNKIFSLGVHSKQKQKCSYKSFWLRVHFSFMTEKMNCANYSTTWRRLYRVSHSKVNRVVLVWWGYIFWFLLILDVGTKENHQKTIFVHFAMRYPLCGFLHKNRRNSNTKFNWVLRFNDWSHVK